MCKLRYVHCSDETTKYVNLKVSENDVKLKLEVKITKNNIDFLNLLNYHEIRYLDRIEAILEFFSI